MTTHRHPAGTLRLPPRPQDRAPAPPVVAPEVVPTIPKPSPQAIRPEGRFEGKPAKAVPKATAPDPAEAAARKRANVEGERQAHEAAVLRHREQTREILVSLRARWPELFSVHTPLATGIARAIQTELGEARLPAQALSRALHWWTQAPSYLVAVAAGRVRRNLDGTEVGVPDEAQREAAAEALRQHAFRRAALAESKSRPRSGPRAAPPPSGRHGEGENAAPTPPPVAPSAPPDR